MLTAYKQGRMGADPSTFWYKGELGFFDNYIIPLAKKLKDYNIFGASSDECLIFALQNRQEWVIRGEAIVASMVKRIAADSFRKLDCDESDEVCKKRVTAFKKSLVALSPLLLFTLPAVKNSEDDPVGADLEASSILYVVFCL
jgi:hypothetical protein